MHQIAVHIYSRALIPGCTLGFWGKRGERNDRSSIVRKYPVQSRISSVQFLLALIKAQGFLDVAGETFVIMMGKKLHLLKFCVSGLQFQQFCVVKRHGKGKRVMQFCRSTLQNMVDVVYRMFYIFGVSVSNRCVCVLLQGYWSRREGEGGGRITSASTFPWLCLKNTKWLQELHEAKVVSFEKCCQSMHPTLPTWPRLVKLCLCSPCHPPPRWTCISLANICGYHTLSSGNIKY